MRCVPLGAMLCVSVGCLVSRAEHAALAQELQTLRDEAASTDQALDATTNRVETLASEQARTQVALDAVQIDLREAQGASENAAYASAAAKQERLELREHLDLRLQTLEGQLRKATSIPETEVELAAEADKRFRERDYAGARRLWRTYEARYPDAARTPEVWFKIGLTYFSERRYLPALGEFMRVFEVDPRPAVTPDAAYYAGLAFERLGQCDKALPYYKALQEEDANAGKYADLAKQRAADLADDKNGVCLNRSAP